MLGNEKKKKSAKEVADLQKRKNWQDSTRAAQQKSTPIERVKAQKSANKEAGKKYSVLSSALNGKK